MMQYQPNTWRQYPTNGITPCPMPRQPVPAPPQHNYWDRIPGQCLRPPMNHTKHTDKYFYTILFLDNYFNQPPPPRPNPGVTIYSDITQKFDKQSPIQWDSQDPNKLIVKHKLQLPVTLEIWDNNNKPIIYAPVLKQSIRSIAVGRMYCSR